MIKYFKYFYLNEKNKKKVIDFVYLTHSKMWNTKEQRKYKGEMQRITLSYIEQCWDDQDMCT